MVGAGAGGVVLFGGGGAVGPLGGAGWRHTLPALLPQGEHARRTLGRKRGRPRPAPSLIAKLHWHHNSQWLMG